MNDREAREYAINAFGSIAGELRTLSERAQNRLVDRDLSGLADRVLAAGQRLHEETEPTLEERVEWLEGGVARLVENVDELVRRVIGGTPRGGLVPVDGDELDREPAPDAA